MSTFRSLKTAPGAVVIHVGDRLNVIRTTPISKRKAVRTADHTRRLMECGEHFFHAIVDLGFVVGCELIETMYAMGGATSDGDEPRRLRLVDEADRFSISLQQIEEHPFVYIWHDRTELMTRITPMRDINTLEEFDAWEADVTETPGPRYVVEEAGEEARRISGWVNLNRHKGWIGWQARSGGAARRARLAVLASRSAGDHRPPDGPRVR